VFGARTTCVARLCGATFIRENNFTSLLDSAEFYACSFEAAIPRFSYIRERDRAEFQNGDVQGSLDCQCRWLIDCSHFGKRLLTSMSRATLALVLFFSFPQQTRPTNAFLSYQAPKDHELNPDPDSDFWRPAKSVVLDRSILDDPDPSVRSEARSRWTKHYLYFLFWGSYDTLHLKPPDTQHETYKLWFYDDFELYLGANFDNINLYGEFEVSPQSEFLDMAIDATREKPGWNDERLWDSGMTVKSRIDKEKRSVTRRCAFRLLQSTSAQLQLATNSG
jgi:hypothetical protein